MLHIQGCCFQNRTAARFLSHILFNKTRSSSMSCTTQDLKLIQLIFKPHGVKKQHRGPRVNRNHNREKPNIGVKSCNQQLAFRTNPDHAMMVFKKADNMCRSEISTPANLDKNLTVLWAAHRCTTCNLSWKMWERQHSKSWAAAIAAKRSSSTSISAQQG